MTATVGYSGAGRGRPGRGRPGRDRLRDHAASADRDAVRATAPDRLARDCVPQVLLIEELARHGCRVEFLDRPMGQDPPDRLLLQIRGAVAAYERSLIAGRMRRGRLARVRAGPLLPWPRPLLPWPRPLLPWPRPLLPWPRPPFGYRLDPARGRAGSSRVRRSWSPSCSTGARSPRSASTSSPSG